MAALIATACATNVKMEPGKDCAFPACYLSVRVVDDGKGGKKIDIEGGGNVRMMNRHKLVAIVWSLKGTEYEFRSNSIRPHTGRDGDGKLTTTRGEWDKQLLPALASWDSYYVTNRNTERVTLYYDMTVYPATGTPGPPITLDPAIFNDP